MAKNKRRRKFYKVRTTRNDKQRIYIHALGFRDAQRIQKRFGGKII